jgi:DNA-binding MarR family transcriptional regulator
MSDAAISPELAANARAGLGSPATPRAERLLCLIHWTSAAGRQLRRKLTAVAADLELSDTELLVVWLSQGAGRVQVELAAAIGVSPAQMSGIVERLGARSLVAMHRSAVDRRRQVWRTTAAGMALLDRAAPSLEELAAQISRTLAPHEQNAVLELCERLAAGASSNLPHATVRMAAIASNDDEQQAGKEAA